MLTDAPLHPPGRGHAISDDVDHTSRRSLLPQPRILAGPGQDLLTTAALTTAALIAAHVVVRLLEFTSWAVPDPYPHLLDVGAELNLPSFWNTALLVVLSCSMIGLAMLLPRGHRPSPDRRGWMVAGLVVAAMAADEAAGLHERVFLAIGNALASAGFDTPSFRWVLPGAVFAGVAVLLASRWLAGLPAAMRRGLVMALVLFGAGALGVEAVSGAVWTGRGVGRLYHLLTAVEESLEMGAVLLALRHVWNAFSATRGTDGRVEVTTTWPVVVDHRGASASAHRSRGSVPGEPVVAATPAPAELEHTT